MSTFRIWKSTGEPENIKADSAEFERTKDGLEIKFLSNFRKTKIVKGVIAFTEIVPPRVVEKS